MRSDRINEVWLWGLTVSMRSDYEVWLYQWGLTVLMRSDCMRSDCIRHHCTRPDFINLSSQITRRYAEFSAAIVGLNENFPNDRVNKLLAQLQTEVENFILRMAAEFPQRKDQLVFLINNYDMMLGVIMVRHNVWMWWS